MAIHYSLELEANCRSKVELIKSRTLGTFALTRPAADLETSIGKQPVADHGCLLTGCPSIIWLSEEQEKLVRSGRVSQ